MDGLQGRGGLPDPLPRQLHVDRPSRFGGVRRCPDEAVGSLQTARIPSSPREAGGAKPPDWCFSVLS